MGDYARCRPRICAETGGIVASHLLLTPKLFKATNPELPIKVFFMVYDNSIEERKYLSLIRREKDAFEKLIKEKSVKFLIL